MSNKRRLQGPIASCVVKEGLSLVAVTWDPTKAGEDARGDKIVDEIEDATEALFDW